MSSKDARVQLRMPEDLKDWALEEAAADPEARGNLSEMIRLMLEARRKQRRAEALEGIKTHEF
jgi:hypothetical protein